MKFKSKVLKFYIKIPKIKFLYCILQNKISKFYIKTSNQKKNSQILYKNTKFENKIPKFFIWKFQGLKWNSQNLYNNFKFKNNIPKLYIKISNLRMKFLNFIERS